ncbi:histidine phosphatase family protein [Microbulbifer sp. VTAC004]|uniref:histidine phosphatase family protein n=1 Tax=unclassified Microbulbifer TaxID=2619833 RepID=UPI004039B2CB
MPRILLARHGEAAKGDNILDPPLTKLGFIQAEELAQKLAIQGRLKITSSPKLRAKQTAEPLARIWGASIEVVNLVTEIPTPEGILSSQRLPWIRSLLNKEWTISDKQQKEWRNGIQRYLLSITEDTIVFCHFMVINSIVAYIHKSQKIQQFRPEYTSITELTIQNNQLYLVSLGKEKDSQIL